MVIMMENSKSFTWQAGTSRGDRPFLGEIAQTYDDIRPGYDAELPSRVMNYAGYPEALVEVGAGTGKATDAFSRFGVPIICIEPDPDMARLLRRRVADRSVSVQNTSFEGWNPPNGGVPLIYSAQAWHWVDANTRCKLAWRALAPGGAIALFGHRYLFADAEAERAADEAYLAHAPQLLGDPRTRSVAPYEYWYATELAGSGLFADLRAEFFSKIVTYDIPTYLRLVATFSSHRQIPTHQLTRLLDALDDALSSQGASVDVQLGTILVLGRRSGR